MSKAIVIGAGLAGIAASLRLRKKGYDVEVFEANAYAGGKLHAFEQDGFRFDAGPSLFTMPHLVDELFHLFDLNPADEFRYIRKNTVCNYFWDDGLRFSVSADADQFVKDAVSVFGVDEHRLRSYLRSNKVKYELAGGIFLEKSLHRAGTYLDKNVFRALIRFLKLDVNSSLDKINKKALKNPYLVQLFNRYATYNGSSPYRTPGIMSMIPHLEMHYGTFLPEGGMHEISQSLYRLAVRQGVVFRFNSKAERILVQEGTARGISTAEGVHPADVVVSNMDIYPTYRNLLADQPQPERILNSERSGSALIFYWGINRSFPELDLHNIFFSNDYEKEFACQFDTGGFADDLTVYINITSKDIPGDAPPGGENWFVMVNAPAHKGQDWTGMKMLAREAILSKLNRCLSADVSRHIVTESILEPVEIQNRTGSHLGSLYGASSNSKFSAFLRHPNFSRSIRDLYFCGGSVHPGGGIPLCLQSAKIMAEQVPDAT